MQLDILRCANMCMYLCTLLMCSCMYIRIIHGHVRTLSLFFHYPSLQRWSQWTLQKHLRVLFSLPETWWGKNGSTYFGQKNILLSGRTLKSKFEVKSFWNMLQYTLNKNYLRTALTSKLINIIQIPELDIFQCSWGWTVTVLFYKNPIFTVTH